MLYTPRASFRGESEHPADAELRAALEERILNSERKALKRTPRYRRGPSREEMLAEEGVELEDVTIKQQCHGLGFGVPKQNGLCGGGPGGVGGGASADALLLSAGDDGIVFIVHHLLAGGLCFLGMRDDSFLLYASYFVGVSEASSAVLSLLACASATSDRLGLVVAEQTREASLRDSYGWELHDDRHKAPSQRVDELFGALLPLAQSGDDRADAEDRVGDVRNDVRPLEDGRVLQIVAEAPVIGHDVAEP